MRDKPRLGTRGMLVWALAIASAFFMAWLDLRRMIERGDFDRPAPGSPAATSPDSSVQAVDIVSGSETEVRATPPGAVDAGVR